MNKNSWVNRYITPSKIDTLDKYLYDGEMFALTLDKRGNQKWVVLQNAPLETFLLNFFGMGTVVAKTANAGTAFHKAIELYGIDKLKGNTLSVANDPREQLENDTSKVWSVSVNHDIILSDIEIPKIKEISINGVIDDISMFGRIDGIDFDTVYDLKTTSAKNFVTSYDKYRDSWQWKIYLVMTERERFIYDIFLIEPTYKYNKGYLVQKDIFISDHSRYHFNIYPSMKSEVAKMIRECYEFLISCESHIKRLGIENNIKIKGLIE